MSPAFGGAGIINTVVTPVQENTTYSSGGPTPLTTYVAYLVNVSNEGGNTINNIRFTAQTSVTDPAEKAVFSTAEGASCVTTNVDKTAIECTIGQLTAGQPAPTIALFFLAPAKVVNGLADGVGTDAVNLSGTTIYGEGFGGLNSPPDNSINPWTPVQAVVLGTDNPTLVKSAVPKSGGLFFTGAGGVPTANPPDLYASSVKLDPLNTFAVLKIEETPLPATDATCLGGNHFVTCHTTLFTAPQVLYSPGTGFLTEIIRVHKDNFAKGAKLDTVIWEYTPTDANGAPVGAVQTVSLCASPTAPRSDGVPCQTGPVVCYKKNQPLADICEWTFINTRNGLMRGY
jgi:hypothetical protein